MWVRIWIAAVLLILSGLPLSGPATAQNDPDAAATITALINAWRLQNNTWPLKPNATLQDLAMLQAQYLLTLADIPGGPEIHIGARGEDIRERALWDPYKWPTYGRPEQIAVTEIAYVGFNVNAALGFWQTSSIHSKAALNSFYREIGVAAVRTRSGTLFVVVLGGRPNVLPVMVDPRTDLLYLSNETFRPGGSAVGSLHQATQVMLLNGDEQPLIPGWIPWQPTIPIPAGVGDDLYVVFSDDEIQVRTEVHLDQDVVLLPGTLAYLTITPTPFPTPAITLTPSAMPVAAATRPGAAPTEFHPPTPTRIASATPIPTETLVPAVPARADLALVYDSRTLALVNLSTRPLDVSDLELRRGDLRLAITRWQQPWLTFSLDAMPPNSCLQVWSWEEPSDLPKPSSCTSYSAVIYIDPKQMLWTAGPFTVQWQGTTLATCESGAGECRFGVP